MLKKIVGQSVKVKQGHAKLFRRRHGRPVGADQAVLDDMGNKGCVGLTPFGHRILRDLGRENTVVDQSFGQPRKGL